MRQVLKSTVIAGVGAILLATNAAPAGSAPVEATRIHHDSKTLVKCDKTTACFEAENSGAGYGLTGLVSGSNGGSGIAAGVYGIANGELDSGVLGLGFANLATGVYGISESGIGGVFETYSNTEPSLAIQGLGSADLIDAYGYDGAFTLDTNADGQFDGFVAASSFYTTALARGGGHVEAFSARSTRDTMEDTGTARLVNGEGAVRFDPALSSVIDASRGYQVFLTPDGDTRGLYVAAKYEGGFIVRETERGRSSLLFDYRVVAHPYGASDARLPRITIAHRRPLSLLRSRVHLPALSAP